MNCHCLITPSSSRQESAKLKSIDKVHGEAPSPCAYLLHNTTLYQNEASFPPICPLFLQELVSTQRNLHAEARWKSGPNLKNLSSSRETTTHISCIRLQVILGTAQESSLRDRKKNSGFFPEKKETRVWKPKLFCSYVMDPSFPVIYYLFNRPAILLYFFPSKVRELKKMISGRSCAD